MNSPIAFYNNHLEPRREALMDLISKPAEILLETMTMTVSIIAKLALFDDFLVSLDTPCALKERSLRFIERTGNLLLTPVVGVVSAIAEAFFAAMDIIFARKELFKGTRKIFDELENRSFSGTLVQYIKRKVREPKIVQSRAAPIFL